MFGIRTIVMKTRYIFHYENVRIHLDYVKNLGEFLEFEAVLSDEYDQDDGQDKINYLMNYLGINERDLISIAYADMLEKNMERKE
jgi:predicted adenylyl cyclase CyaB